MFSKLEIHEHIWISIKQHEGMNNNRKSRGLRPLVLGYGKIRDSHQEDGRTPEGGEDPMNLADVRAAFLPRKKRKRVGRGPRVRPPRARAPPFEPTASILLRRGSGESGAGRTVRWRPEWGMEGAKRQRWGARAPGGRNRRRTIRPRPRPAYRRVAVGSASGQLR